MSLMKKLKTLVKLSSEAPLRNLVEANDIAIFEQELRDAEVSVKTAKAKLTLIKTEKAVITKDANELKQKIQLREQQAVELLQKAPDEVADPELEKPDIESPAAVGVESVVRNQPFNLVDELATEIANDEAMLAELFAQQKHLQHSEDKLSEKIKASIRIIQSHHRQLHIAKANKSSLHAHADLKTVMQPGSSINASIRELDESFANIKVQQDRAALLLQAEEDVEASLGAGSMDKKLKEAGVKTGNHDASQVLARLKAKATL